MIMSKLLIASYMQLIAISYVTSDIAKSSFIPLSFRSLDSTEYTAGMEYQTFDDHFPRSDEQLFTTYDYLLPKDLTIPIRITGDAVDIPFAKFAEGLDKNYNFEKSNPPESTDEIRNFVKINTPPMNDQKISDIVLNEILKNNTFKIKANTTTRKTNPSTIATKKITTTTPTIPTTKRAATTIPTTKITTTTIPTTKRATTTIPTTKRATTTIPTTKRAPTTIPTTKRATTTILNTTTSKTTTATTTTTTPTTTQKRQNEVKSSTTIPDLEKKELNQKVSSKIKVTPNKVQKGTGRSFHEEDDVINNNFPNNSLDDSKYIQKDNFERYQKELIDSSPDDDKLQKIDETAQLDVNDSEDKIYEGWLSDGTPIPCKKSVVPFLNCKLEMFHVGELPFFYYGLTLLSSSLADKVCPCPMPRLESDCDNTAQRVARYMEHICHAYLRM